MVSVEKLIAATRNTTVGNHAVEISRNCGTRSFTYHGNEICRTDDRAHTFETSHCGWFTQSTSKAINDYTRRLERAGYTRVAHD